MQVGTTKDQGLCNKSSAAVHPGALAAGILPQHNSGDRVAGPGDVLLSGDAGVAKRRIGLQSDKNNILCDRFDSQLLFTHQQI